MIKFVLSFLLITCIGYSQEYNSEKHLIDVELEKCLATSEGQTTAGIVECVIHGAEAWDAELNKYYKLLMSSLNAEGKQKLKESQRQWILFRDKEFELSGFIYGNKQGTMWKQIAVSNRMRIIKDRALELTEYYNTLINY